MRKFFVISIIGIMTLMAGAIMALGIVVSLSFRGTQVRAEVDRRYVDGKFYRRPIHPGFITQRFPAFKASVVVSKGRYAKGLPSANKFRKR